MDDAFSLIRVANISNLLIVQELGRRDPRKACLVFHASEREISTLITLSMGQIFEFVEGVGKICLFPPRTDLMPMISQSDPAARRLLAASTVNRLHEVRKS